MIVITAGLTAKPGSAEVLRAEGIAHSARSRLEDGCLSHRCFVDAEAPERLFFYEEWRDMAAVEAHFRHPDMARIGAVVREHAAGTDGPTLLEATTISRQPDRR